LRVSESGEFGLIAELRKMLGARKEDVILSAGDDAAVFRSPGGDLMAFTADAMVERVHFDPAYVSWHALGYKSLAVNISDLAAMGGCPSSFALVVLGLREDVEIEDIKRLYEGLIQCSEEFSCCIVGGDIVRCPQQLFVSISLAGGLPGGAFLTRSGARPGQSILISGTLGDSALGLKWLLKGGGGENACARKHLYPQPRLREGNRALELGATAAIDISDGLVRDLGHICEESGVGARIMVEDIPLSKSAAKTASEVGEDPLKAALWGGEDYELIIVADENNARIMRAEMNLTLIGEITQGSGVTVIDSSGRPVQLENTGYDHFEEA